MSASWFWDPKHRANSRHHFSPTNNRKWIIFGVKRFIVCNQLWLQCKIDRGWKGYVTQSALDLTYYTPAFQFKIVLIYSIFFFFSLYITRRMDIKIIEHRYRWLRCKSRTHRFHLLGSELHDIIIWMDYLSRSSPEQLERVNLLGLELWEMVIWMGYLSKLSPIGVRVASYVISPHNHDDYATSPESF